MRTYTCLIVDDEDLIIQRLEMFFRALSDQHKRFLLVGKAYSGAKGIEEALLLKPDIILSDIVMPHMDGITMIEELRTKLPDTQYILLTAYSSFEYAQRAIRAHIMEYIIKVPLKEAELRQALDKAADTLDAIRTKETEFQSLNLAVRENKYRVHKQFFNELIRGEIAADRASDFGSRMQVDFFRSFYCCFIVELSHYESFRREYSAADQGILKYAITNVVGETLAGFGTGAASELHDNRFIGFLAWDKTRSTMDTELACRTLGRQIVAHLKQYLNQEASVMFSAPYRGWESINQAYSEAAEACEDLYYQETKTVNTGEHRIRYHNDRREAVQHKLLELRSWTHRGLSRQELDAWMAELHQFVLEGPIQKLVMAPLLREIYRDMAAQWTSRSEADMTTEEFPLLFATFREQLQFISDFVIESQQEGKAVHRAEITKARRFMEQNLRERLTLQAIAEHVNLAPTYFSSLFKKTMSEGVVDYMNRRKIDLSIELLQKRDYSILELCEETGIVNEGYFCKLFKQHTGMTPKQYRKKLYGPK
ncbi:response regulator [Paenibacillus filicis]|uniref:Response regulator n=1 Tax=Paenibacillus filicis TaxID=669464 RepID=A0ABU9DJT5_9BACL